MRQERAWRLAAAICTVVLAAALCFTAIWLYAAGMQRRIALQSDKAPLFTRENTLEALKWLLIPAALWLAAVIGAACRARGPGQNRAPQRAETALRLLRSRVAEMPREAQAEQAFRRKVSLVCGAASALCAAWSVLWLSRLDAADWTQEQVMDDLLIRILIPAAAALTALLAAAGINEKSRRREIRVLSEAYRGQPASPALIAPQAAENAGRTAVLRITVFSAALILMLLGILNGGLYDVLIKAVNICTECIGLG